MTVPPALHHFYQWISNPRISRRILEACVLAALLIAIIGERSLIAYHRRIMPAGDVFNFQSIARNIKYFQYPSLEKRLPGFPIAILLSTELGFNPTRAAIVISIVTSAATTGVLYLLGRHLKFPSLPLALVLSLTIVAPLLTINGVRPLSDTFFMFFTVLSIYVATVAKPTKGWALAVGGVLAFTAFIRYEGVPTAGILLILLWLRMSWRLVLLAAAPLILLGLLWIPAAVSIYGSWENFGYFQDAQTNTNLPALPGEYMHVVKSAGFGKAWAAQDLWSDDEGKQQIAHELISHPDWWISLLASIGILWLLIARFKESLPVLLSFAFYPLLPAWWFTYSRYVAPMSAFYFFAVAAGAVGIWMIVRSFLHRAPVVIRGLGAALCTILLMQLIWGTVPILWKEAQARGLENNGRGYSLYQAVMSLEDTDYRVAVSADYLMAYMMFGTVSSPKDHLNNGRGMYLSSKPEATPKEYVAYLREHKAEVLIDAGEDNVKTLVEQLKQDNIIVRTTTFQWPRQDGDIDTTYLHFLEWPH